MPISDEIRGLAIHKVEAILASMTKSEAETMLHGLYQVLQSSEQARFGSVTFHFVAGKLKTIETRETFQSGK